MVRNRTIKLLFRVLRRCHLYLGLALIPWVFLYGVTAYLFNHPAHFSPVDVESVSQSLLPDDWATRAWKPEERAKAIVQQLNERFSNGDDRIRLDTSKTPRFDGSGLIASFDRGERTYSYSLPMSGSQAGVLRIAPKGNPASPTGKAFFEVQAKRTPSNGGPVSDGEPTLQQLPLRLEEGLLERLQSQVAKIANQRDPELDVQASSLRVSYLPALVFQVDADGQSWECKHDALVGSVSTKPVDNNVATSFSWRQFWLRLHTSHGYHPDGGTRWIWAIVVDVMAAVMVFWGISGIAMWWQMKATRRWGGFALASGFVIAVWLGYGMYRLMA
ncbi:hypothetical protein VN12_18865 [Pirellula sp. SH-Sr6A]|uniref:hypothetical protein n=1 Tax=Pirellula sp. SH-Sr6A TaxID=1632865 RepID=UPI00078C3ADC|nr:hypothetical protein [Pirellula sp. SH-Sr6A]AMV34199.1 hypothetical protein VN12_18865 [Pirellula sp. SH-Sr6A]